MRGCSSCGHCCCHQESHAKPQSDQSSPPVEGQTGPGCEVTQTAQTAGGLSVTFATSPVVSQSPPVNTSPPPPLLKPVLKNSTDSTVKKVELRPNKNAARPRPRSVAVPNPASSGSGLYSLDEVRLTSLSSRPQVPQ